MMTTLLLLAAVGLGCATSARADPPPGMVLVPAGEFLMGPENRPVNLPAFYLDATEVTNRQYQQFVRATGWRCPVHWHGDQFPAGKADYPVVNITWDDAAAYARWAGKRLPTEAEWEKGARGVDGRPYPWGSDWDGARTNLGAERIEPVGAYPTGASPYSCLDMIGNVWEWTASWYGPATADDPPDIRHGEKYKVIRGGGAIGYYGVPPGKECFHRGYSLPFGRYDCLGLRCAADVEPTDQPQPSPDPAIPTGVIKHDLLPHAEVHVPDHAALTVTEYAGVTRDHWPVTSGVPLPQGWVISVDDLTLTTDRGRPVPCQTSALATWPDGSPKWVLLDFQTDAKAHERRRFRLIRGRARAAPTGLLAVENGPAAVRVSTGPLAFLIPKDRFAPMDQARLTKDGQPARAVMSGPIEIIAEARQPDGQPLRLRALLPESVAIEDAGPLRATVRIDGWLGSDERPECLRYRLRLEAYAGLPFVGMPLTVCNSGTSPMWLLRSLRVTVPPVVPAGDEQAQFGSGTQSESLPGGELPLTLHQGENGFVLSGQDWQMAGDGRRAPGWVGLSGGDASGILVVHDFWQQYPAYLIADHGRIAADLCGGEDFEMDAGLAKTWHLGVGFDVRFREHEAAIALLDSLFAVADPAWYRATGALGEFALYDPRRFPEYEHAAAIEFGGHLRTLPHAVRNFGDTYFGGTAKGKHAFTNLEYDIPQTLIFQFVRTGDQALLEAAIHACRHQADIDTNHRTGGLWKHSPRHTTMPPEFGHVFVTGLLNGYFFSGDRQMLEAAREVGDWVVRDIADPGSQGNERQIGWPLMTLASLYEATRDQRYLDAMRADVDRLIGGLDATGKFSIRWDNRIAFFNGIAMSGLLAYYRISGDPKVADAVLRVADRTLGFYPEYACRTVEGFAWAYRHTGDPRYLTAAERSWEVSLDRSQARRPTLLAGPGYLAFRAEQRLAAKPDASRKAGALRAVHLSAGDLRLIVQPKAGRECTIGLARHGCRGRGRARLIDRAGKAVDRVSFTPDGILCQTASVTASHEAAAPFVLELRAPDSQGWDIALPASARLVVESADGSSLTAFPRRIYFRLQEMAEEIRFTVESTGEGFHGATLYDPEGYPLTSASRFIDLDDQQAYQDTLIVPVLPDDTRLWSLELRDSRVVDVAGVMPWFAESAADFFLPRPTAE